MKKICCRLLFLIISINFAAFANAQVGPIIWQENFNAFDTTLWNSVTGNGCNSAAGCGWGNQELEYYKKENIAIEDIAGEVGNKALALFAKKETVGSSEFTSGKITSANKIAVKFGLIEVRMKSPAVANGLWPAFWLLGTNDRVSGWPQCGEMDMMEMGQKAAERTRQGFPSASVNDYVGANLLWYTPLACSNANPTCAGSIAADIYYDQPYISAGLTNRFLIYRLYWDDKNIRFTVEDKGVENNLYTGPFPIGANEAAFTKPFYFIMNLAVGGNFTDAATASQVTATLPGKLLIDYIRVRKWNGKGEVILPGQLIANGGADQTIKTGNTAKLNASGSYGNIAAYSWTENGKEIASGVNPTVTLSEGTHRIMLTITDANGATSTDEVSVQIGTSLIGEVIWEDNFNSFNEKIWNPIEGNGCNGASGCGFGNHELEYYSKGNISVTDIAGEPGNKALVLEARKETNGSNQFTSGKITTENKLAIKYGVVEVRMKVPDVVNGLWPAAWLLGSNIKSVGWPKCGEIDMMEMGHRAAEKTRQGFSGVSSNNYVAANLLWYSPEACSGENPTCAGSIAYDTYYNNPYSPSSGLNNRFVTYRMYWDESSIRFTALDNGNEIDLYADKFPIGANEAAFKQPFYFLLDLAVGGDFTDAATVDKVTAPFPAKMYIDYVRVSKWKGKGEVAFSEGTVLANAGADIVRTDIDKNGKETIILDASASYGNISEYIWSENGAQIAKGMNPTIDLPTGNHFINLTITDSTGKTSTDEVFVDIREIIWEDNFNAFETQTWNKINGDGCSAAAGCGWGNQELENYQENNIAIEPITGEAGNNALVIEAKKETVGNSQFTSGKLTTENKMSIKYGLIEVRMKTPDLQTGLWPAVWLLGNNLPQVGWPKCGEIDMMEMGQSLAERTRQGFPTVSVNNYVGSNLLWYETAVCNNANPTCAASIAADIYYDKPYTPSTGLNTRFAVYRLYWDNSTIRFTVEDKGAEYDLYTGPFPISANSAAFNQPFYFIMNLAVGGNFTDAASAAKVTATLPAKMLVDYVRIMKFKGKGEVAFSSGLTANAGVDVISIDKDKNGTEKVYLDGSLSSDMNGSISSYSWKEKGIEIATGPISEINLARGIHSILLTVTDNDGNSATDQVVITVTSGGSSPIADAGKDTSLFANEDDKITYTLDGLGSSDPNDSPLTYSWKENDKEIGTTVKPTLVLSTGIHKITLTVMNEDSVSSTDEVIITVIDIDNDKPLANGGADKVLNDNDGDDLVTTILDGSGCSDADGIIISYSWLEAGKEIAIGATPSVKLSTGKHLISLIVTDNDGDFSSDTVLITVNDPDNKAPFAKAGIDTLIVDSERKGKTIFKLDASESYDSDGTIAGYSWMENDIEISNEKTKDVELAIGMHKIVLKVTDNEDLIGKDTVIVNVSQLPVAKAGNDTSLVDKDGNGEVTIKLDGSESSAPFSSISSYSWKENDIEKATSEKADASFSIGTHKVLLTVTNAEGLTASDEVKIIVSKADNVAPIANAGADSTIIDVNNDGLIAFNLDASLSSDADGSIETYEWFENSSLVAYGQTANINLATGEHVFVLKVTDNEGAFDSDTIKITIKKGACVFEACTKDYTVRVISNEAGNTTVNFIPAKVGTGDNVCLLYYGTNPNEAFPGNNAKPNQAFKLNNIKEGQKVYFYYTYNLATGGEQNTSSCKHEFVVGSCFAAPNQLPVANAGNDINVKLPSGANTMNVTLDGSGSYDSDGSISSYSWKEGSIAIANIAKPTVSLTKGTHTINLIVTDNSGATATDLVIVTVDGTNGLITTGADEVDLYPSPVHTVLFVRSPSKVDKIEVYNLLGSKLLENSNNSQIDISVLRQGIYMVIVNVKGKYTNKKILKM